MTDVERLARFMEQESRAASWVWIATILLLIEHSPGDEWPERSVVTGLMDACWDSDTEAIEGFEAQLDASAEPIGSSQRYDVVRSVLGPRPKHLKLFRSIVGCLSEPGAEVISLPAMELGDGDLQRGWQAYFRARESLIFEGPQAEEVARILLDLFEGAVSIDDVGWGRVKAAADAMEALRTGRQT